MPLRDFNRNQQYLLPPSLDEWVPADHPVRYVATFIEELPLSEWQEMGIDLEGQERGAPAYDPQLLVTVWVAGFMLGIRSSRGLERACREQVTFRWLTGNQCPDHNTLHRFYQKNRDKMRDLFGCTVETAAQAGLVDLALVAVDGTKVAGNASGRQTLTATQLRDLLKRTEAAIADLEAQNVGNEQEDTLRLPEELHRATSLRERVRQALETVEAEGGPKHVNLTDPEARLQKTRQGYVTGYNAQGAVTRVEMGSDEPGGLLLLAADVTAAQDDHQQLIPMVDAVVENTGVKPAVVAADGGYYSGAAVAGCDARAQTVVMPATTSQIQIDHPYHKQHFRYDAESDSYTCPHGQRLTFRRERARKRRPRVRIYRADPAGCRACPAFEPCARKAKRGRSLEIGPDDELLTQHRVWMQTDQARALSSRRKTLIEPAFGILKEVQGLNRFLLRGLENIAAEWSLLAVGFNLRTLARAWGKGVLLTSNGA